MYQQELLLQLSNLLDEYISNLDLIYPKLLKYYDNFSVINVELTFLYNVIWLSSKSGIQNSKKCTLTI